MTRLYLLFFLVFSFFGNIIAQSENSFTDPRDGKTYKTIRVGNQIWMAENLNFESKNSWCAECDVYGRIYNFEDAKTVSPPGWHLPSKEEWNEFIDQLGGKEVAGGKMKTIDGWINPNTGNSENIGATNEIGFSGKPAHYRTTDGKIRDVGHQATYWTSSSDPDLACWTFQLSHNKTAIECIGYLKSSGFSIRCVKDFIENDSLISQKNASDFLHSLDEFQEWNNVVSSYLQHSSLVFNRYNKDQSTSIDFNQLRQLYAAAYVVDSTILFELAQLSEIDSTLNLHKKLMDYVTKERMVLQEFNRYFYSIEQSIDKALLNEMALQLVEDITETYQKKEAFLLAAKYFRQKYKLE